jgi:hypothetical protein
VLVHSISLTLWSAVQWSYEALELGKLLTRRTELILSLEDDYSLPLKFLKCQSRLHEFPGNQLSFGSSVLWAKMPGAKRENVTKQTGRGVTEFSLLRRVSRLGSTTD